MSLRLSSSSSIGQRRILLLAVLNNNGSRPSCRLREHMLRAASEMDAAAEREPVPAYLPREREVRMDLTAAEEA